MGIIILNEHWSPPQKHILLKRAAIMFTFGYVLFCKILLTNNNLIALFDWEMDHLKTRVIDKKVFKKLECIAKEQKGDFVKNMNELYNSYLRELYTK